MLNYIQKLKLIDRNTEEYRSKFNNASKQNKDNALILWITGLVISVVLALLLFHNTSAKPQIVTTDNPSVINQQQEIETLSDFHSEYDEPDHEHLDGQGLELQNPLDSLNPFTSFQKSIVDGISEILGQIVKLYDDFVGFTPNVAKGDGQIVSARGEKINLHVNKFYEVTQTIAWALLPLVIVYTGALIIIEGGVKAREIMLQMLRKFILFAVAIVSMRFFFSIAIDLCNAINKVVLQSLIGIQGADKLSEALLTAVGLTIVDNKLTLSVQDTLNQVGEIILWVGLLITVVMLLFQFIVRFCHLLVHMIMFPIALVIGLLPGGGNFFRSYIEELFKMLFVQPILLIGIAFSIEVIKSVDQPIPKLILGLGSLAFINLIPAIVNRAAGIVWGIGAAGATAALGTGAYLGLRGARSGFSMAKGASKPAQNMLGSAVGSAIASKLPGGSTTQSVAKLAGAANATGSIAKTATPAAKDVFGKVGMKPLQGKDLKPAAKSQQLFSASPDFSGLGNTSLKDASSLNALYMDSNFDGLLGSPMTESPLGIQHIAGVDNFVPSSDQSAQAMQGVMQNTPVNHSFGKTFDMGNQVHLNHLSDWYSRSQSATTGNPVESYHNFANNPANRNELIKSGVKGGYFEAQKIKTVKTYSTTMGGAQLAKYYNLKQPKKVNINARNSTTQIK